MLSIDTLINVEVSLSQSAAIAQNTSTLLVMTNNTVIDLVTRLRNYASLAAVAADFGTNGPEYAAAVVYFGQSPTPSELLIGRWAQSAAAGQLIGGALSAAQQSLANFTGIADGGFTVSIDGAPVEHIVGINLTGIVSLNGLATALQTALGGAATVIWNAAYSRFEVTSATTGGTSAISFFTAAVGGGVTDIAPLLGLEAAFSGSYVSNGQAAETALAAATLMDSKFGGQWYALVMPTINADADHVAVASFIQATTRKHFYGCTTQDAGALVFDSTTDLPYLLKALNLTKSAVQYSSTSLYSIISALARMLTVNYAGQNTTITLMWKQQPGLIAENLTDTQLATLEAKNCNVFAQFDNNTSILLTGTTCKTNVFIDTVIGADVFAVALKTALYNILYQTPTKVGQTDSGMHILTTACEGVAIGFVANGFLSAGLWAGPYFGALQVSPNGDLPYMDKGYYFYAAPLALQAAADRSKRMAGPIQGAGQLTGAIHTAFVGVTLNP